MEHKQKVLIVGGGFAGIKAALELSKNPNFAVGLISDRDHFRYYPTIFHAVTGGKPSASSIPLAEILRGHSVGVVIDEATEIDRQQKHIKTKSGRNFHYDHLVLALGVVTNYFGIKGLDKYSYGLKSLEEAQRLHDHLHQLVVDERRPDLDYVVIGGGPTGVEVAAELPSYIRHILQRHGLGQKMLHIDLVEAMPRILPNMPADYSKVVAQRLRRLGVRLRLNQKVEAETADALTVSDHDIKSHTVIWTAGVTNHPFFKHNDFALNDHGKVVVDDYLASEENIYVIGDNADTPYSGMAQTALYDANFVAKHLKRLSRGRSTKPYKPKKPIYVTPVGPRWAAVLWGRVQIYGWGGWLLRKAADLMGYRDYEPWWRAAQHWLADSSSEETCQICNPES